MPPTVCMSEMTDRSSFYLDQHLLRLCVEERRNNQQTRKKSQKHRQLFCDKQKLKLQMGLVVEECRQSPTRADCPSLDSEHNEELPRHHSLVHITLRTLALLRRNQQLQNKLSLLQAETRAFVESVIDSATPTPAHD